MKKLFTTLALVSTLLVPFIGFADTTGTSTLSVDIQARLDAITKLNAQIKDLQQKMDDLRTQQSAVIKDQKQAISGLLQTLRQGSTGDQVKILQTILAADPNVYPDGLITGFFGRLTGEAVKRFQKKHGLDAIGLVGPRTRELLNKILNDNQLDREDFQDALKGLITRPCTLLATTTITIKNKKDDDRDENENKHEMLKIARCQKHDSEDEDDDRDEHDHHATSTKDFMPPVISSVNSSASSTTARITWTTNESATTKVYFGTAISLDITASTTMSGTESGLTTSHSKTLTGLAASTTYSFIVESADTTGNTSRSAQSSFTTPAM